MFSNNKKTCDTESNKRWLINILRSFLLIATLAGNYDKAIKMIGKLHWSDFLFVQMHKLGDSDLLHCIIFVNNQVGHWTLWDQKQHQKACRLWKEKSCCQIFTLIRAANLLNKIASCKFSGIKCVVFNVCKKPLIIFFNLAIVGIICRGPSWYLN